MRLKSKDTLGLALVACSVGLLVLHGRTPHAPARAESTAIAGSHAVLAGPAADVVAFVDVRLPGAVHSVARTGVVVVRHGVVSAVGGAESVQVPVDALIVRGSGSNYLVAASSTADGLGWSPVVRGIGGDLVLYSGDPRDRTDGGAIAGRLIDGRWMPQADAAHLSSTPAGH